MNPTIEAAALEKVKTLLQVYLDQNSWKLNGICDPNSCYFDGMSPAQQALALLESSTAKDADDLQWYGLLGMNGEAVGDRKVCGDPESITLLREKLLDRKRLQRRVADLEAKDAAPVQDKPVRDMLTEGEKLRYDAMRLANLTELALVKLCILYEGDRHDLREKLKAAPVPTDAEVREAVEYAQLVGSLAWGGTHLETLIRAAHRNTKED